MGARYPYYLLSDSVEGQHKEAEVTRSVPSIAPAYGDLRQGFVYERVPHITLRDIANNAEIDVIWENFQHKLEQIRTNLNDTLQESWEEWQIPREADADWPASAKQCHADWWELRIARQREIDASIAAKAEFEYLYDKPYEDKSKVRVAGPFTVESLSPHRVLGVDEFDELIDPQEQMVAESNGSYEEPQDFATVILDNLRRAGVQQAHKEDRIEFSSLSGWPGHFICAEGRYEESGKEKKAGIFIGPEFGTVSRPDLYEAATETAEAGFDVLVACAFNYEAHTTEFSRLGKIPVLKARMNPDLHMAEDLKNTGSGNLFVIFGEPDIDIFPADSTLPPLGGDAEGRGGLRARASFKSRSTASTSSIPRRARSAATAPTGSPAGSSTPTTTARAFFVRHAYFLGANDPLQVAQDHAEGRDRRGGLVDAAQRHLASVRPARIGPHRGQGDQPPRRRGDEGLPIRRRWLTGGRYGQMLRRRTNIAGTRVTFEVGLEGRLRRARKRVKAADHTQAVLKALRTGRLEHTQSA